MPIPESSSYRTVSPSLVCHSTYRPKAHQGSSGCNCCSPTRPPLLCLRPPLHHLHASIPLRALTRRTGTHPCAPRRPNCEATAPSAHLAGLARPPSASERVWTLGCLVAPGSANRASGFGCNIFFALSSVTSCSPWPISFLILARRWSCTTVPVRLCLCHLLHDIAL